MCFYSNIWRNYENQIIVYYLSLLPRLVFEEVIGTLDTKFRIFSRDDDIIIEAFDDPKVEGVACHLSRAASDLHTSKICGCYRVTNPQNFT